jgi:phosphate transport system protein
MGYDLFTSKPTANSRQRHVMSQGNEGESVPGPSNRRPGLVAQEEVWGEVLELAAAVESMLNQAVQALCEGSADLAAAIKAQERRIDEWEVRIEKECLRILALYDPVASDLRRMVSVLKVRADLERVSDLATKIARRSKRSLQDSAAPPIPASLDNLARMATCAFSEVVTALRTVDAVAARSAIANDKEIDGQCRVVLRELKSSLRHHPEWITPLLRLVNSARNLKRIGDHTVTIAEAIVYIKG